MARRRSSKNSGSGGCLGVLILVSLAVYLFQTYWQVILVVAGIAFLIWGIARLSQNRNAAANNFTQEQLITPTQTTASTNRTVSANLENRSQPTNTTNQNYGVDSRNVSHEVDRQIREMFARRRDLSTKIDKAQKAIWKLNKSIGRNSEEKTKQREELIEGKELLEGRLNAAVYTFREASTRDFVELRSAFEALANSSAQTHDSTPSCRSLITRYNPVGDMQYILYSVAPICMTLGTDLLCIVPGYIVRFKKDGTYVTTYTCKALDASLITGSYDEQVTQTRWLYAKQDGGRDMRYSNNRLISYNTTRTHTVPNMLYIEVAGAQYRYEADYSVRNKVVAAIKAYTAVEPTKAYDPAYHVLRLLDTCDANNPNLRKLHRIIDGDEIKLDYDVEDEDERSTYSSPSAAYGSTAEPPKPSKAKRFFKGVLKVFVAGAAIATAATFAPTVIEKIESFNAPTATVIPARTVAPIKTIVPTDTVVPTTTEAPTTTDAPTAAPTKAARDSIATAPPVAAESNNEETSSPSEDAVDTGVEAVEQGSALMIEFGNEEPTEIETPEPIPAPTPEPTPEPLGASALQGVHGYEYSTGSRGDATRYIQQMLIDQSYLPAGQADGVFGPKTEAAVKSFQEGSGLPATGVVDLATQFKLAELESGFVTVEGQDYEYAGLKRYGVYRFDGGVFIGILKSDQSYQEGTLYYEDGTVYAGAFKNNQRSGKGEAWYPNGDYYNGNWKDDLMNGKGVYHFGSVDSIEQYDGEWVDGKMSGKGTYTLADGTTIKAIWENNQQVGWWK